MAFIHKIKSFYLQNKVSSSILLVGIVLYLVYFIKYKNVDWAIQPMLTYFKLISFSLITLALFLFCVKYKKYLTSNIFLLIFFLLIFETTCFYLLGSPEKYKRDFRLPDFPENHVGKHMGTVPYADSVYNAVKINGNDTVYNVFYSIDNNWKRITPDYDSSRSKYALFFGCSIAFGEGLSNNQTFPYYFQQITNQYNSYNFAYPGYGTNHMLARLQFQNLTEQVKEKEGVAFYLFFDDHVNRSIGSMNTYIGWLSNAPYYEVKDGKLTRNKAFKDGRFFTSEFYELVYQTSIVNYFKLNFPLKLQPKHLDLTLEIIQASKEKYKEQFGNDNFYVILYPTWDFLSYDELEYLKKELNNRKIKFFDLRSFIKYGNEHTLGGDPHPNANTNKMLVEELVKRLNR